MSDNASAGDIGERIERLLEEIRASVSPSAWQRVDELIRLILEMYGSGLGRIMEMAARDQPLVERLTRDRLIASLLVLHGIHPEDFAARVNKALATVRPYLDSHGGNVELVEADEASGVVRLRLEGSCQSCPSSAMTVRTAVESALRELVPELGALEVDGLENPRGVPLGGGAPRWIALDAMPQLSGGLGAVEIGGAGILLCRLGRSLYAYLDSCPRCASPVGGGVLEGSYLTCPSCGERYDVRMAGRSMHDRQLHLQPVPVLEDAAGVKIALS